jgi:hypothetical protein
MNFSVTCDYQGFSCPNKKASVFQIERKFVLFLKNELCNFIFFLHFGHNEIQTKPTLMSA